MSIVPFPRHGGPGGRPRGPAPLALVPTESPAGGEKGPTAWPGRSHGLSQREAEMICWISRGLTNDEIARVTYLSPNSVKSSVRSAYRKIGVTRRAQAVLWGVAHDMCPEQLPPRLPSAKGARGLRSG